MRHRSVPRCSALFLLLLLLTTHRACGQKKPSPPQPRNATPRLDEDEAELTRALAMAANGERVTAGASTNDSGPSGIVPFLQGFNASLGSTQQHDSAGGWQWLLTPTLAYRFNWHFSAFATVPVYAYINLYEVVGATPATKKVPSVPIYGYRKRNFRLGDTYIAGQYETRFRAFDYNFTSTLSVPTGDDERGIGASEITYNLNNHFERAVGRRWIPAIELGIGNSPNLVDSRVRKSYIDIGTNAHFQIGTNLQLPRNISFTTEAYEELPLSMQTFTSTTTNGKKGKDLRTYTMITNRSVGEDNGFLNTLDIPVTPHLILSGFYNRSLRNKIDTAGMTFTFLLKPLHSSSEPTP